MNKPRLYLDFGKGYEKDKADTFTKIINRLEEVYNDVDKYMVIQEINNTDEILLFGDNRKEIEEYIETIDDRNSLKLQNIKSDMQKILRRR